MYAVMRTGGKQYRVSPGDVLDVERLDTPVGETVQIEDVLLVADEGNVTVGSQNLEPARVVAKVVSHPRDRKIEVFKYKPRKRYRRHRGHRQELTRLRVMEISL